MTRDKTTNPGEIAAILDELDGMDFASDATWSRFIRNHHATIIAALRAAGEVERMREALEKIAANNGERSGECQYIARRALAGSAT